MKHENKGGHNHHNHHKYMISDFRKRFLVSVIITIQVLLLSPMIQEFLGLGSMLRFKGDLYILFILSSIVFFYGGYPFLKGLYSELKAAKPRMITLIAQAIIISYIDLSPKN